MWWPRQYLNTENVVFPIVAIRHTLSNKDVLVFVQLWNEVCINFMVCVNASLQADKLVDCYCQRIVSMTARHAWALYSLVTPACLKGSNYYTQPTCKWPLIIFAHRNNFNTVLLKFFQSIAGRHSDPWCPKPSHTLLSICWATRSCLLPHSLAHAFITLPGET